MDQTPTEIVFSISDNTNSIAAHSQEQLFSYSNGPAKVPGPWKRGRPRLARKKITTSPVFQFIGVSKQNKEIDTVSRSTIRRHARKIKSRPDGDCHKTRHHRIDRMTNGKTLQPSPGALFHGNLQQISGVDPFSTSCIPLEPYMHDLLSLLCSKLWRYIYSLEGVGGWNPMKSYWLPLAFHDAAMMHSLLACTQKYVKGYRRGQMGAFALHHIRETIRIVNKRITEGVAPISRQTIAVVAGIAVLEKGSLRHTHWRTHMKGLKALVELAGGLEAFASDPMILNKVFRADLYGSLDAGEPPFFDGPAGRICDMYKDGPGELQNSVGQGLVLGRAWDLNSGDPAKGKPRSQKISMICDLFDFDRNMSASICGLEKVADFWNTKTSINSDGDSTKMSSSKDSQPRLETTQIRLLLTSIQYKLISPAQALEATDLNPIQRGISELLRLALIMYTLTILGENPETTSVGYKLSSTFLQALQDAIEVARDAATPQPQQVNVGETGNNGETDMSTAMAPLLSIVPTEFLLWSIFLAVAVLPAGNDFDDGTDVKPTLLKVFSRLLGTRTQVPSLIRLQISQYLWVPSIHDGAFDYLWADLSDLEPQYQKPKGVLRINFVQFQPSHVEDGG